MQLKLFIILILILLIMPQISTELNLSENYNGSIRGANKEFIIYWNLTTYGDIYSDGEKVGFADGNGTINLYWDFCVDSENTLIIEPGVKVISHMLVHLNIYGNINAIGTKNNRIEFLSPYKTSLSLHFFGLSDNANSQLTYCNFTRCFINYDTTSMIISNNIIIQDFSLGIGCGSSSQALITNNTFLDCMPAISAIYSSPIIKYNTFNSNVSFVPHWAIELDNSNSIIMHNTIKNYEEGIFILYESNPTINYNEFINVEEYFIYNDPDNTYTINAEYNFWGTLEEKEIQEKIDSNVDYDPWLDMDGNEYYSEDISDNKDSEITFYIISGLGLLIILIIVVLIIWKLKPKYKKDK